MKVSCRKAVLLSSVLIAISLAACAPRGVVSLTDLVNPFIGTGGSGHTFPGASLPFGMVQLSPDTRLGSREGSSGYFYEDDTLYGFSHTHLSGTKKAGYGDVLLMPTVGSIQIQPGSPENTGSGYASKFSHDREGASPGYYRVWLEDYGIDVELTATLRAGFHRYTFPRTERANIIIDLTEPDPVSVSSLKAVNRTEIAGMRRSSRLAEGRSVYFAAQFSKPFIHSGMAVDGEVLEGIKEGEGKNIRAFFQFQTEEAEVILVKVGISAVSIQGARKNLRAEIEDWDFDRVRLNSREIWNQALNKIEVEGRNKEHKVIFYTALYHALLCPNLFMDVDGQYNGTDQKNHVADDFVNYTMPPLWNTFRAAHPLLILLEPLRTVDFVHTLLAHYENGGMLSKWEKTGNGSDDKIGYHAASVVVDAYKKGIRDFDADKTFNAMRHSAELENPGLRAYRTLGYIPSNLEGESVSKTLEYAYDDWCIAQMAQSLGRDEDYVRFIRRAQYYKNLFDPSTGFMRAKTGGFWFVPFDPYEVNANYTEANAWQYCFFVPHDLDGLIRLMGGKIKFSEKLDRLFDTPGKLRGREQEDITGLIGMYAHGNEPSHHMAYLFNYVLQPWKTQQKVREIMNTLYSSRPDGLCGNENCGQMSAWYVLSALGFYPVCPGQDIYVIGTPLFARASIGVGNGKTFIVEAKKISPYNIFVQRAELNSRSLNRSYIKHADIVNGGELVFFMGGKPNTEWASKSTDTPPSAVKDVLVLPVPFIRSGEPSFQESTQVALGHVYREADIFYTTDGSSPTLRSNVYKAPFLLSETATVKMFAYQEGLPRSSTVSARFTKTPSRDPKLDL